MATANSPSRPCAGKPGSSAHTLVHHGETFVVDEKNGIYVVTSRRMVKFVWNGEKLSTEEKDGAWESGYEWTPDEKALAAGAISRGSGTTPTLILPLTAVRAGSTLTGVTAIDGYSDQAIGAGAWVQVRLDPALGLAATPAAAAASDGASCAASRASKDSPRRISRRAK